MSGRVQDADREDAVLQGPVLQDSASYGGGAYVSSNGTLVKQSGGVMYESNTSDTLKNIAAGGLGHAVYAASSPVKIRDTTAGTGVALDSGASANWDEQ
jgi:hypothetical protein